MDKRCSVFDLSSMVISTTFYFDANASIAALNNIQRRASNWLKIKMSVLSYLYLQDIS